MGRFCYISKILPGKTELIRKMWKDRTPNEEPDIRQNFWDYIGMTGFESWLQQTPGGDFMIHCLEGESFSQILKNLRDQMALKNSIALKLKAFYQNTLGKDYSLIETEPKIEQVLDISLSSSPKYIKHGFFFPLLPGKEEEHRQYRKESMGPKRARHEASMRACGVSHLSVWLQKVENRQYIVVYTERSKDTPLSPKERLQAEKSEEWKEISSILTSHTGLTLEELSPNTEWLTRPKNSQ